jgi:hypothetical protein
MKGYGQHYRSAWLLVILLIVGGIAGGLIGQALSGIHQLAFLNQWPSVGLPATTLNLEFLTLTFGFAFKVNPVSIAGFIAALILYLRL